MHIHLDLIGGIAGDMFLAAALDAELVTREFLEEIMSGLGLGTIQIVAKNTQRGALTGTHIIFQGWGPEHESDHRHLSEILKMIDQASFDEGVKEVARELFIALGKAESKIHGIPLETVHFHEVGAVDSILDFVGAAAVIHRANATWSFSDVPCGKGEIVSAHGVIPVPAPATADLLRGLPTIERDVRGELVTPTGAAILHVLAGRHKLAAPKITGFSVARPQPLTTPKSRISRRGTLVAAGYGCGTKSFAEIANVVRLTVFEEDARAPQSDRVARIETDIDDMQPEALAWFCESYLPELGAIDVTRASIIMKKGRIGTRLTVLGPIDESQNLARAILEHTSTFGVRIDEVERQILNRRFETVQTAYGPIQIKLGLMGDRVLKTAPEFEDCARAAKEHGVDISLVYQAALKAAEPLKGPLGA